MASGSTPQAKRLFFLRYWRPLVGYLGLIFSLGARPHLAPPLPFRNGDKVCHLAEYSGPALLLVAPLRAARPRQAAALSSLASVAAGLVIGAADENFQRLVPGRTCDLHDGYADGAGVVLSQCAGLLWARARGRPA